MARNVIGDLYPLGQSPWFDNLTRPLARGGLRVLMDEGIRGVTSNPTIFEKAIATGDGYDEQLASLAARGTTGVDAYWELVLDDIASAADLLEPLHRSSDGTDGFVSVEVDPRLAHDTDATIAQAGAIAARLGRTNVMIKIPATRAGLRAISSVVAAGINVNVTLIFSLERYDEVIEAYLSGLEQRLSAGDPVAHLASVASFFVSRVDTETDARLPDGHPLRGRAAVANAKRAYRLFEQRFAGERWEALAARGAQLQRPLWASTSTKNAAYSPTLYVDELIGPATVNTLAPASVDQLRNHPGLRAGTVGEGLDDADEVIEGLAAAGVDFAAVTDTLERDGVAAFEQSFVDALATLDRRSAQIT